MKKKPESKAEKTAKKKKRRSLLRFLRWGAPPAAAALAAVGIMLLAVPQDSARLLSIITGALFCAVGILFLAFAFTGTKAGFIQLILGAGIIGLSVWLFVDPEGALNALMMVFAAILLTRGFLGILDALFSKRTGAVFRQVQLVVSLAVFVFSVVLFFNLFEFRYLVLTVGILMLADAASEAVSSALRILSRPKEEATPKGKPPKGGEETAEEGEPAAAPPAEKKPKRRFCFGKKREPGAENRGEEERKE